MKTIFKTIYLFVILLCVAGCNSSNSNAPKTCSNRNCYGVWMDNRLILQYKDNNSVDWLDTNIVKHYDIDSIKIYYLAPDGCAVYYFNELVQMLNEPRISYSGFDIEYYSDKGYFFFLDVFGSGGYHKHGSKEVMWGFDSGVYVPRTVYIQFNENDTDTVVAESLYLCGDELSQNAGRYCTYDVYGAIRYNGNIIVSSWENNQDRMSQGIYPTIIKDY